MCEYSTVKRCGAGMWAWLWRTAWHPPLRPRRATRCVRSPWPRRQAWRRPAQACELKLKRSGAQGLGN
eukprot:scaffold18453_cov65-Phaeocystis_antarctica.AAC.3